MENNDKFLSPYGVKKVSEKIFQIGRSLLITEMDDSKINFDEIPDGTLRVNPETGELQIKLANTSSWSIYKEDITPTIDPADFEELRHVVLGNSTLIRDCEQQLVETQRLMMNMNELSRTVKAQVETFDATAAALDQSYRIILDKLDRLDLDVVDKEIAERKAQMAEEQRVRKSTDDTLFERIAKEETNRSLEDEDIRTDILRVKTDLSSAYEYNLRTRLADAASSLQKIVKINGVDFNGTSSITINAEDLTPRIPEDAIGMPGGVAPLDTSGKISSDYLPSYVDDIIELDSDYDLKRIASPEKGKIYLVLQDGDYENVAYRWSGSKFVKIYGGDMFVEYAHGAEKLISPVKINGVNFNGAADIEVPIVGAQLLTNEDIDTIFAEDDQHFKEIEEEQENERKEDESKTDTSDGATLPDESNGEDNEDPTPSIPPNDDEEEDTNEEVEPSDENSEAPAEPEEPTTEESEGEPTEKDTESTENTNSESIPEQNGAEE